MDSTNQGTRLRVTLTGDFDKNAVRRLKYALGKYGKVEPRLSFPKTATLPASLQLVVTTVHGADELKAVLEQLSSVQTITIGANDA